MAWGRMGGMTTGYIYCAHVCCFAIIVGKPGDLCDDCAAQTEMVTDQPYACDGCDNDGQAAD